MLLIDNGRGAVIAAPITWRDRLAARLHAGSLDRELAAGASPDASVPLALRAQSLTTTRSRRTLARGLQMAVAAASEPGARPTVALNRAAIRNAQVSIVELTGALLASGPVSVWGAAQTELLLTDGAGALHNRRRAGQLLAAVRRATAALDLDYTPSTA